jgi:hypothetical protein
LAACYGELGYRHPQTKSLEAALENERFQIHLPDMAKSKKGEL